MALPNIIFNRAEGGIGRPPTNNDYISGMIFYYDTLPSGFGASDRIKPIYSLEDAVNLGIVDTHTDETKATGGNIEITVAGGTADVETVSLAGAVLGSYTVQAGDATTDVATGLRAAINALTVDHGYVAAGSGSDVALTAPDEQGQSINTGVSTLAFASSGTGTATVTQFSSGVGSGYSYMYYHIKEYFRMIPNGKLYVGIYAQGTYDGAEIQTVQNFAEGAIRQMGVYITHESFTSTHITASQTYATALRADKKPLQVLLHSDMSSATLSSMTDLTTLTAADVAVILGEDGSYHQNAYSNTLTYLRGDKVTWTSGVYIAKKSTTGNAPFNTNYWSKTQEDLPNILGFSVSTLGNALGCVSLAKVNESISWPEKFILNSGDTLALAGFSTGDTYISQTTSLLNTLNSQHYIFLRKFIGDSNTYNSDSWTAITETSDYATIENNRTLDKLERNVYAAMVSKISSPIYLNADGTLTEDSIAVFKNIVDAQASQMKTDLELSDYEVTIDPTQDVLTTSTIAVTVQIIPVGIARTIEINDGFTTQIK